MVRVEFDPKKPSTARMYNYYLGGKDNFAADREAAEEVLRHAPSLAECAKASRSFMARAVRYCAETGVRQFIDIGTGIPTYPNVCNVAREIDPTSVMVGVDNDPQVLVHDWALLEGAEVIEGDIREPSNIVNDQVLNRYIDWSEPVAVLFVAVLHFVTDAQEPAGIVATFRDRMAPGSLLVMSHASSTGTDPQEVIAVERVYERVTSPVVFRTEEAIGSLFAGFDLLEPGLVLVQNWRNPSPPEVEVLPVFAGVGRLSQ